MIKQNAPRNFRTHSLGLIAVFIAYFTGALVLSTLNVSLPRIAAELNGMSMYSWAVSVPALTSAIVIIIFGKLSDMYGRRLLLLIAMGVLVVGASLCASARTFPILIITLGILGMGQGAIPPLCFSVLGDMFTPLERSKWAGLLSISSGITALVGPLLGGLLVDKLSWRYIFVIDLPFILLSGIFILLGLPSRSSRTTHTIDVRGTICLAIATSTMIMGLSWAGVYHWISVQVISLLIVSTIFWILFLRVEARAAEPMLDPHILTNRTFLFASFAAMISLLGITGITVYFPLFLQAVLGASATLSGKIITPYNVLTSVMGIPAGLIIARTWRYKWMYVAGYGILAAAVWGAMLLNGSSSILLCYVITIAAGFGLGAIPTINALVAQYAVPRRLLGAATSGMYFFASMGRSLAPAILGSVFTVSYNRTLSASTASLLQEIQDKTLLSSLSNPRVLLSTPAMNELRNALGMIGSQGAELFTQAITSLRRSMDTGLHTVFLIGAFAVTISLGLILNIPEIRLEEREDLDG
jgi:MFS family permease